MAILCYIDEEKREAAETLALLSLCPVNEAESEAVEVLAMLSSSNERPDSVRHTCSSSCDRELQSQVCSEHSYSLSTLFCFSYKSSHIIDPGCSTDSSCNIEPSCNVDSICSVDTVCGIDLSLEEIYEYAPPEKMYSNYF
ncbi:MULTISPECIES: hypothetical protein [Candidatus Ichthyocystis]|uniref:hypothetical protein n=1 Tax=Candidatus Ichthyocystis TaxID=2929841 RepID=UPI000B8539E1|nr:MULTISPECIES: hypothetical protein [Ichthyocystis]